MLALVVAAMQAGAAGDTRLAGRFSAPVAFDVLPSLSRVAPTARSNAGDLREVRPDRGAVPLDSGFAGDAALQSAARSSASAALLAPVPTLQNFEGLSNQDNFNRARLSREPAGPGRRSGAGPLRGDGQPRVCGLQQERPAPARSSEALGESFRACQQSSTSRAPFVAGSSAASCPATFAASSTT